MEVPVARDPEGRISSGQGRASAILPGLDYGESPYVTPARGITDQGPPNAYPLGFGKGPAGTPIPFFDKGMGGGN